MPPFSLTRSSKSAHETEPELVGEGRWPGSGNRGGERVEKLQLSIRDLDRLTKGHLHFARTGAEIDANTNAQTAGPDALGAYRAATVFQQGQRRHPGPIDMNRLADTCIGKRRAAIGSRWR